LVLRRVVSIVLVSGLAGCGPSYSPDTYASNAVQQAAKAEQGVVVGVRAVSVSAAGAVGTVTGAAAGGIAGSQVAPGPTGAFTALGGSLIGGIAGNVAEHAVSDTKAFEYIVRKPNGELVSVTQKDTVPLAIGQNVLVIAGAQARVVPDYTVPVPGPAKDKPPETAAAKPAAAPADAAPKPPPAAEAPPPDQPKVETGP
jgi:outer membrane lipoprotein SlyB